MYERVRFPAASPVEVPLSRIIVTRSRGRYDAEIIQSTLALLPISKLPMFTNTIIAGGL